MKTFKILSEGISLSSLLSGKERGKSSAALSTSDEGRILCHTERSRSISGYKDSSPSYAFGVNRTQNDARVVLHSPFTLALLLRCLSKKGRGESSEVFSTHFAGQRKCAFTLAEVLITLGIIGIVAAMTLPALIQKNNNRVVETRLQKFYSAINQAILMAENDYGDKKIWFSDVTNSTAQDEDGNFVSGSNSAEVWFDKYFAPYLKITGRETLSDGRFIVYFADGGALMPESHTTRDWLFYPGNPKKCLEKYPGAVGNGICRFNFNFNPDNIYSTWYYHYNKGMEPYKYAWSGNIQDLYNNGRWGCNKNSTYKTYCTAVIQMNNWKIPDDYPLKVSY